MPLTENRAVADDRKPASGIAFPNFAMTSAVGQNDIQWIASQAPIDGTDGYAIPREAAAWLDDFGDVVVFQPSLLTLAQPMNGGLSTEARIFRFRPESTDH